jgi:hypothetical protein
MARRRAQPLLKLCAVLSCFLVRWGAGLPAECKAAMAGRPGAVMLAGAEAGGRYRASSRCVMSSREDSEGVRAAMVGDSSPEKLAAWISARSLENSLPLQ